MISSITLVTEFFPQGKTADFSGGVEARTYFIHKYLHKRISISVISRPKQHIEASTSSILPRLIFQLKAFTRALKKPADLIEGSNFNTYLPAFAAAKLKGIPVVAWYPDVYGPLWFQNFSTFTAITGFLIEKLSLLLPWDHIIAMSQATKNKLIKSGVDNHKITVVYGGVEASEFKKLKIKKYPTPTICTLARLVNYKKIDDLIHAVALLNPEITGLRLIILGEGPERASLVNLAKRLGLTQQIIFMGNKPHSEAMKILKRSTVFSLPSLVEGFGLVTIEAMAAGTPYVNSKIPQTVEITGGGQGGLLFMPGNHQQLAAKLKRLLTDKKLYAHKRRQGLAFTPRYDWQHIADQTLHVYQNTVSPLHLD